MGRAPADTAELVLETSAGRFQAFYVFDKPQPVDAVKPMAERLKAFGRCDHGTSDISHVWRVAGTLELGSVEAAHDARVAPVAARQREFGEELTSSLLIAQKQTASRTPQAGDIMSEQRAT